MRKARGFTLVELMISMVLGLVIVGSVMAVMLANKRSYRTNEGLSQVQESARTAFELLAHDIRQADGNGCVNASTRTANALASPSEWWQSWFGMTGYDSTQADPGVAIGTAAGERVAGTDSIRVESMDGPGVSLTTSSTGVQPLSVNTATSDFAAGDIMLVCDFDHAVVFQASSVSSAGVTTSVSHNTGIGTPGNCSQNLNFTVQGACPNSPSYTFQMNSQLGRLVAVDWYVGNNGRAAEGGRSLYRLRIGPGSTGQPEEIVAGITDMQMQFRANGANTIITDASLVTDWTAISSVLIRITAESGDINLTTAAPGANTGRVLRTFNYLVSLRNRLP